MDTLACPHLSGRLQGLFHLALKRMLLYLNGWPPSCKTFFLSETRPIVDLGEPGELIC